MLSRQKFNLTVPFPYYRSWYENTTLNLRLLSHIVRRVRIDTVRNTLLGARLSENSDTSEQFDCQSRRDLLAYGILYPADSMSDKGYYVNQNVCNAIMTKDLQLQFIVELLLDYHAGAWQLCSLWVVLAPVGRR